MFSYRSAISEFQKNPLDDVQHPDITPEETKPIYEDLLSKRKINGYIQRNVDNLFKIQGTSYLPHRSCYQQNYIRECFFVCLYTSLLAINHSLSTWNYRKIDVAVENGIELFHKADTLKNVNKRHVDRILLEDTFYNIFVKKLIASEKNNLIEDLENLTKKFKYLLLQFPNATFLVQKSLFKNQDFYNLFDSYKTLELYEIEKDDVLERNVLYETKIFSDENTASWILFPDIELLTKYVQSRVNEVDLKENYSFFSIHIKSFEKAFNGKYDCYFSEELSVVNVNGFYDENIYEIPHEKIKWLETKQIVPWSRNERCNAVKQVYT